MSAKAPDHHEIVRVVQLYVDAFNECDARIQEAALATG